MKFIIERKVLIAMVFTAITMLGFFSYKQLPVELLPNTQLPYLFVSVGSNLEVDPKYMENQAIIPLEGAIATLKGVKKIESQADEQNGRIQISFEPGTDVKYVYLKLLAKVDEVKKTIPSEFFVQVFKFDLNQINNEFMTLQARGGGGADRVRQVVNKEVVDRLKNINGVANLNVFGGREKSVEIILHEDVCKANGVSPSDVRNALAQNTSARAFVGKINHNNQMIFLNVISEYTDLRDLQELIVKQQGALKLKDIAEIRFGVKEQDSYSRVNGKESVTIQITRDLQSNIIELSGKVKDQVEVLNKELKGKDIELVIQQNSAETMEKNIGEIINLAITGGILAIFILWIFLKNLRLVAAVALAIPISVYVAYNFFYYFGISINSLTLIGIALAIGMLLDNSVVVLENIYRLASKKVGTDTSVLQGTKEVWRSVFAATLTTVMIFVPFAFSKDFSISTIGKHVGISIVSTLLISLAVALFLIPMITHTFLKFREKSRPVKFENISYHNRLIQIYLVLLKTCMRNPAKTILGTLAAFFLSLIISLSVSMMSNQEPEVTDFNLYITMPAGTNLQKTDLAVSEIEKRLANLQEKKDIVSQVYEEEAVLTISLQKDYQKIRKYTVPKIKQDIFKKLDGVEVSYRGWEPAPSGRRFSGGGGSMGGSAGIEGLFGMGSQPERVIIKGSDYNKVVNLAYSVSYHLSKLSSIQSAYVSVPPGRPQLMMDFDKQLMALYDIPASSVLSELNSFPKEFSSGAVLKQGTEEYGIQIKILTNTEQQQVRNLNDLKKLPVRGTAGSQFELQNITDFNFSYGASAVKRINQEKQLEVTFSFVPEINEDKNLLNAARLEVDETVAKINPPSGVVKEVVHETQDLSDFKFLIIAALLLIYMILASVFQSFSTPVILMLAIPMAATGSALALVLTGNSLLSIYTLIGFVILIGIVVNNGIILIDYSQILQKRGFRPSRALITSGLARIRPVLITTMTTVIALIPLAMAKTEYVTKIGAPFAITLIGGLSLSTLLTLIFIPTQYSGLKAALKWISDQKLWAKLVQSVIFIGGIILIYYYIDTLLWKIIDFILVAVLTPASFYFVQNSLKKASEKLIGENEPLRILIRNLVKVYDGDSRFMREWKSGIRIRERLGFEHEYHSWKDFDYVIWKLPIVAFIVYFIYGYLNNGFWSLVLPVGLYLLILNILSPFKRYGLWLKENAGKVWPQKVIVSIYNVVFWIFPSIALFFFFKKFGLIGLVIPVAFFWYLSLFIKVTSDKLYKEKVNITRIKGRFTGIRKGFYRFVLVIPVIGKKKVPFKALKGVSFTIENGMFGLLGPNGAGKSTLMRIICGILEPSYGQITINGIDVREKREELQGLIGYLPQEFGMYENITAWEFLNYMGILKKLYNREVREQRIEYVLKAVHMFENKDQKIGSFSGGMKQRIGIAQILLHLPRILVVDEPTAGLDPRERIRFRNLLVELSKERIVIFSTHIIEDVASSCNRVAVVKSGTIKYLGEPIQMARIAEGKVWMADMTIEAFEQLKDKHIIIHHMRDGDNIRVRCISDEIPFESAKQIKANLEDAYLFLLNEK